MTDFKPLTHASFLDLKIPKSNQFGTDLNGYEAWASFLKDKAGCRDFILSKDNLMTNCPFHEDKQASFGLIDVPGKQMFNCFGCDAKGGLKKLVTRLTNNPEAWNTIKDTLRPSPRIVWQNPDPPFAMSFSTESALLLYRDPCDYWQSRGLTEDTVQKYQLGANVYRFTVAFLVWNIVAERYMGICERDWDTHPAFPAERREALLNGGGKYRFVDGVKRNQSLYGANFLTQWEEVHVFEGAIDAMNFTQRTGIEAVATWGSSVSEEQLAYLAKFQRVVLVPDKDRKMTGLKAAESTEAELRGKADVKILLLEGPYKDYTEAVMAGADQPKLHPLPTSLRGRHREIDRLYKSFERKHKK